MYWSYCGEIISQSVHNARNYIHERNNAINHGQWIYIYRLPAGTLIYPIHSYQYLMHLALWWHPPAKTLVCHLHVWIDPLGLSWFAMCPPTWETMVPFVTSQGDNSTTTPLCMKREARDLHVYFRGAKHRSVNLASYAIRRNATRKSPAVLRCRACCLSSGGSTHGKKKISSSRPGSIETRSGRETCATCCHAATAATAAQLATWSEGCAANLIWVKRGAQSLPISSDLINPNRVIVPDDKEVPFVRGPHCQIIVPLSRRGSLRAPPRKSSCQYPLGAEDTKVSH